jgi:hypothetical protein
LILLIFQCLSSADLSFGENTIPYRTARAIE